MSEFLKSITKDRTQRFMELLQSTQDLNERNKKGTPLLHIAIENQNFEILEFLLNPPGTINKSADPNSLDKEGQPPLFKAIEILSDQAVKMLLQAGADINYEDPTYKETPLSLAIAYNSPEIVTQLMVNKSLNLNVFSKENGSSIMNAIRTCNIDIFEILLADKRINIFLCDEKGNSIFHVALEVGGVSIIEILLEYLENKSTQQIAEKFINIVNKQGNSVLHQAVISKRSSIYNLLLHKADSLMLDKNIRNKDGYTSDELLKIQNKQMIEEREEKERKKSDWKLEKNQKKAQKHEDSLREMEKRKYEKVIGREQLREEVKKQKKFNKVAPYYGIAIFCLIILIIYLAMRVTVNRRKTEA